MKRILLAVFALAVVVGGDSVRWAVAAINSCPGKCPFCP